MEIVKLNQKEMEFDMIGVDASLANAFRRILIAEVLHVKSFRLVCFNKYLNIFIGTYNFKVNKMRETSLFTKVIYLIKYYTIFCWLSNQHHQVKQSL